MLKLSTKASVLG